MIPHRGASRSRFDRQPRRLRKADAYARREYDHDLRLLRSHQMTRQIIRTSDAPNSPLFSQAIKAGNTVYVSGIVGIDPKTNQLAGSTIQEQTRQALVNCQNILRSAGAALTDVVEVLVLLTRPGDLAGQILPDRSAHSRGRQARRRAPECSGVDQDDRRSLTSAPRSFHVESYATLCFTLGRGSIIAGAHPNIRRIRSR